MEQPPFYNIPLAFSSLRTHAPVTLRKAIEGKAFLRMFSQYLGSGREFPDAVYGSRLAVVACHLSEFSQDSPFDNNNYDAIPAQVDSQSCNYQVQTHK